MLNYDYMSYNNIFYPLNQTNINTLFNFYLNLEIHNTFVKYDF